MDAVGQQPPVPFRIPPGIRLVRVDLKSGLPSSAGVVLEAFKAGTEPGSGYQARGDTSGVGTGDEGDPDAAADQQNGQNNGAWGLY